MLAARPAMISFEAAKPRHEHEWEEFEMLTLPDGARVAELELQALDEGARIASSVLYA